MDIHLLSTRKLLKRVSEKGVTNAEFGVYFFYLIILYSIYYVLPYYIDPNQGSVKSLSQVTIVLKICFILSVSFIIYWKLTYKNIWAYIKTYIAFYSNGFIFFAIIKIIFTFLMIFFYIKIDTPKAEGFENSHFFNLSNEWFVF